jgi:hypothetical protein
MPSTDQRELRKVQINYESAIYLRRNLDKFALSTAEDQWCRQTAEEEVE